MCRKCSLVGVALLLSVSGARGLAPDAADLPELHAEVIGAAPLPYQPIRLRFTLKNDGKQPTRKIQYLESGCSLTGIKGPANVQFQPVGTRGYLNLRPTATIGGPLTRYFHAVYRKLHQLAPGHQQSVSGPFVGGGVLDVVRPLFTEPGEHALRYDFSQNATEGPHLQAEPVLVTVGKPAGDDAAWFDFFQKKKNVADGFVTGLAYRHGVQPREGGSLEALMTLFPKSSYVPYAHFVLAAHIVYDYEKKRLDGASVSRLKAAWDHLTAIDMKDFAYAPDALVLMKRIKEYQEDQEGAAAIAVRLQKEYPDAIEWLEEQARDRVPFDKIQENRRAAAPEPKKP
ncbi:MAG: hypothetical protein JNM56_27590 [Planctomycetia bacterium]|nr:hypothetical protein [Planctomycetia bacterium]